MALLERVANLMTAGAKGAHRLLFLRRVRIVTSATLAFDRRRMTRSLFPEGVDFMAIEAQRRLFLEEILRFVVTVGVMADRAVPMGAGNLVGYFAPRMAGHAQAVGGIGQKERLIAGMSIVTQFATPLAEGFMAPRLLALILDLLMALHAQPGSRGDQQMFLAGAMGIMARGAIAGHEGPVQTGPPHVVIDRLMAFAAQSPLILDQQSGTIALMRLMAGSTAPVAGRRMDHRLGRQDVGVTIATELVRRFEQQRRLSRRRGMGAMAGQAVPLRDRFMGVIRGQGNARSQMFEFMTFETKLG